MRHSFLTAVSIAALLFQAMIPLPVSFGQKIGAAAPPPSTSYGNPQGSPTVTTNITPGSGTVASIVDGNTGTGFKFSTSTLRLQWIMLDFGAGTERCIDAFKVYTDNPGTTTTDGWLWAGSNDLISFVDLVSLTLGGGLNAYTEYTYTNAKGFRYYILWQKPGTGITTVPLYAEFLFKIDTAAAYTVPTNVPSYAWKYGFKDRTGFISITTTSTIGGGTISNAVDGEAVDNTTDSWWFGGGQTGRVVRFDFGTAVKLTEVTFWQDNTTSQGTFQSAWSDDDASYTDFGSPVTWGGAAIAVGDLSAMPAAHRYVRFTQVTGTTSSSPFQREVLFKGSMT